MKKTRKARSAPDCRPPVAISYARFSTQEQAKGDSLRRQTEATEKWCERNGIALDETLSCKDAGKSAYHGKNRDDKAALGTLLELVKQGRVPRGSYLVVENLDRLSRQNILPALGLLTGLLEGGMRVVQLSPAETVYDANVNPMMLMMAIMELSRGHSESAIKSARAAANWENARRRARESGELMTRRLPGWIRDVQGRPELIAKRAVAVRRIFDLSTQGYGAGAIVKRLRKDKLPAFGDREMEDGRYRQAGAHYGSGDWTTGYVRRLLYDRRVLGEFQPRDRNNKPVGEPIPGYFPAVIEESTFFAARAAASIRRNPPGRIGDDVANLFGGLLRNARDGSTYRHSARVENGVRSCFLLNTSYIEGKSKAITFPYAIFEQAMLSQLAELKPADVLQADGPPADEAVLRGELAWVREQKEKLAAELLKGDVSVIGAELRKLEARDLELSEKLDEVAEEAARPMTATWKDAKSLTRMLADAEDVADVRLRLRAALRRIIDEIRILVVPRGRVRFADIQVFFAGGGYRSYLIIYRPPHANKSGRKPGAWFVHSHTQPDPEVELHDENFGLKDLRNGIDVITLLGAYESYPMDLADRLLKKGNPIP